MSSAYTTKGLRALLASRKDSEHAQIFVRVVICSATFVIAMLLMEPPHTPAEKACLVLILSGLALSFVLFALLLRSPAPSVGRRVTAMMFDYPAITAGMILVGEGFAFAYAYLMWITIGYGLRYGPRYRVAGVIASLVSFLLVIVFTDFWQQHLILSIALWVLLGAVPLYEAGLLTRSVRLHQRVAIASEAKTNFIATLSHELRTPLNAIILMSELLAGKELKPVDRVDVAEAIGKEAMMMLGIVQQVLHISEIEAGKIVVRPSPTNVHGTVRQVARVFAKMAARKEVGFQVEVSLANKNRIIDEIHFRQILTNVVGNAVKFTDEGMVLLEFGAGDGESLKISIKDTGQGMDAFELARLFDPFKEGRNPPPGMEGSGLGMHITKSLVEAMGGEIVVSTKKGNGTTVEIMLPAPICLDEEVVGDLDDGPPDYESILERHRQLVGGKWVLIVDDVKSNLDIVTRLLRQAGHKILPFHSPRQALETVLDLSPDLVLVDFHMPDMNAPEFIRRLRSLRGDAGEEVPVVVMTADASSATRSEAMAAGASALVHKPVQTADLLLALERGISFGAKHPVAQ